MKISHFCPRAAGTIVDIDVYGSDTLSFVDPSRIHALATGSFPDRYSGDAALARKVEEKVLSFFTSATNLHLSGNSTSLDESFSHFREPKENHLGFSPTSSGTCLGEILETSFEDSVCEHIQSFYAAFHGLYTCPHVFLEARNIARDRTSDIIVRACFKEFAEYTHAKAKEWGVAHYTRMTSEYWDTDSGNWKSETFELPSFPDGGKEYPLIFTPLVFTGHTDHISSLYPYLIAAYARYEKFKDIERGIPNPESCKKRREKLREECPDRESLLKFLQESMPPEERSEMLLFSQDQYVQWLAKKYWE